MLESEQETGVENAEALMPSPDELKVARTRLLKETLAFLVELKLRNAPDFFAGDRLREIVLKLDTPDPHSEARKTLNDLLVASHVHAKRAPFKHGDAALEEIQGALDPEVTIVTHHELLENLPLRVLAEYAPQVAWEIIVHGGERETVAFVIRLAAETRLTTPKKITAALASELAMHLPENIVRDLFLESLRLGLNGKPFTDTELFASVTPDVLASALPLEALRKFLVEGIAKPHSFIDDEVIMAEPEVLPTSSAPPPADDALHEAPSETDTEQVRDEDLEVVPDGVGSIEENLVGDERDGEGNDRPKGSGAPQ